MMSITQVRKQRHREARLPGSISEAGFEHRHSASWAAAVATALLPVWRLSQDREAEEAVQKSSACFPHRLTLQITAGLIRNGDSHVLPRTVRFRCSVVRPRELDFY